MRQLILTLATLLTLSGVTSSWAESPTSPREMPIRHFWNTGNAKDFNEKPLFGDVESIDVEVYTIELEDKIPLCFETYTFNEYGHVSKIESRYIDGTEYKLLASYNERGDRLFVEEYRDGELDEQTKYTYDYDNNTYTKEVYNASSLIYTSIYELDDKGEIVCERVIYPSGSENISTSTPLYFGTRRDYLRNGCLSSCIYTTKQEVDGVTIKTKSYNSMKCKDIEIYNSKGQIVVREYQYLNGDLECRLYKYNDNNLLSSVITTNNGNFEHEEIYTYDDTSNLISVVHINDENEAIYINRLWYDDMGNVIQEYENPDQLDYEKFIIFKINYRK